MSKRTLVVIALTIGIFILLSSPSLTSFIQTLIALALVAGVAIWLLSGTTTGKRLWSSIENTSRPKVQKNTQPALERTALHAAADPFEDVAPLAVMSNTQDGPIVYTVKVPRSSDWKPERAISLARELIQIGHLALRITGNDGNIQWQIVDVGDNPSDTRLIVRRVRNVYPEAEVIPSNLENPPFMGTFYRRIEYIEQVQDFVGPIKYPHDFKQSDPLAIIANVMNDLEAGESISYTVYLGESDKQFYQEASKQTTSSNWAFQHIIYITLGFLSIVGAVVSVVVIFYKLFLEKKPDKYRESDMNVIWGKLNDLPLIRSFVLFEVNSPYQDRLQQFDIAPALLHYGHEFQKLMRQDGDLTGIQVASARRAEETSALSVLLKLANRPYKSPKDARTCIFSPSEIASLWHLPHEGFAASNIAWMRGKYVPMPSIMRGKYEGVCLGDNLYGGSSYSVNMLPKDRAGHMIIVGKTGMGKSTLLHNLIHQDIAAGRGVALIDPSPRDKNLVPRILQSSIPAERMQDVIVLDLADRETPPPLNILSIPTKVPQRDAVAAIRAIFERVYGSNFRDARMGRTLGMALHTVLVDETPTVRDIARVAWDVDYRERLLDRVTSEGALDFWERFAGMASGEQEAYFDPILGRIEALYDNELLYPAVCHPDPLDLGTYIQQGKIILISLSPPDNVGLAPSEQELLGSILVSQFQLAVMAQRPPERFFLYVDEAQHFVTTALPELFNEARGQNLSLTLSNQFLKQLVGDTLHAIMGNVGAIFAFQVGTDDAHVLTADIMKPHFTSYDLTHMEIHHAAVSMRYDDKQQEPFSLAGRDAPIAPPDAAEKEAEIRALSREQYTPRSRDEVIAWLARRYPRRRRTKGHTEEEQFSEPL